MISFEDFRIQEGSPIYQQILWYLKRGAAAGTIRDGDELPSRRVLSARLAVNPNTVQKAYHLLEEEGLMTSRPGAGSVMTLTPERMEAIHRQLSENDARFAARLLRGLGLEKAQALALIERFWEED